MDAYTLQFNYLIRLYIIVIVKNILKRLKLKLDLTKNYLKKFSLLLDGQ